jgi:hypothetical protein
MERPDKGIPFRDIFGLIGRHVNLSVVSIAREALGALFGFLDAFVQFDHPTSGALTRELLGWQPRGPILIEDLEEGFDFED